MFWKVWERWKRANHCANENTGPRDASNHLSLCAALLEDEDYESLNYAGLDGLIDGAAKPIQILTHCSGTFFFN